MGNLGFGTFSYAKQQGPSEFEQTPAKQLRQRDKRGRPNAREIDCQLTPYAHYGGGTLIPELVFPVTQYKTLFEYQQSKRETIVFRD